MPRGEKSLRDLAEEILEELSEFEIGGKDLDVIFEPLVERCAELAKNERELRQCIEEGISTLKTVVKKVVR
ncbi:hypothetical protein DRO24_02365 [Candidatus Bathyarchaeota archaeon]|nr:MAG: hypothetical protein DRO24_02365 [Candidatus Bathyarchaeota archaeon]